jgi:hypothetical protein
MYNENYGEISTLVDLRGFPCIVQRFYLSISYGRLYIFDKNSNEYPDNLVPYGELDDNLYQLVVNPAGLFMLVRIESFRNIPTTLPTTEITKKTLRGINRK